MATVRIVNVEVDFAPGMGAVTIVEELQSSTLSWTRSGTQVELKFGPGVENKPRIKVLPGKGLCNIVIKVDGITFQVEQRG